MKKKIFYMMLTVIIVLSFSLVTAAPASAATLEVGSGKPYTTIAAAISAATDGDTITVYDGTYGKVVVNKELTIQAAVGNNPVVDGGGSGACFGIYNATGLSDVTIEGFDIRNATYGIWLYGAPSTYNNITLSNNDIHNHSQNGILVTDAIVNGLTISNNNIDSSGIGISFANNSTVNGLIIEGNTITNNNAGLSLIWGTFSNVAVTNCCFEGNAWEHIDLGLWGHNPTLSNVSITECQFLSGPWCGVYIESSFGPTDIEMNLNNFSVNNYCGLFNTTAIAVNAEKNWWGHASGPSGPDGRVNNAGKIIGKGDAVYGPADCDPWLPQPVDHTPIHPVPPGWLINK